MLRPLQQAAHPFMVSPLYVISSIILPPATLTYLLCTNSFIWEFSDIFSRSTSRAIPKFRDSASSGCAWLETALFTAMAVNPHSP